MESCLAVRTDTFLTTSLSREIAWQSLAFHVLHDVTDYNTPMAFSHRINFQSQHIIVTALNMFSLVPKSPNVRQALPV